VSERRVAILGFQEIGELSPLGWDGCRSIRDTALPWLGRFETPGVLFVPTDYVGGRNDFDRGVEPAESICDWDDLRALRDAGVAIQSHACSHRSFSVLDRSEREGELVRSKRLLEEQLGTAVEAIAFPFGDPGPDADRQQPADAGYRAAFTYRGSPVRLPLADRFRIERIAVGPTTDLRAELEEIA
jgi:peptidoglycan/xylan/chitin deacetylase (PgdA/CDA1 family)